MASHQKRLLEDLLRTLIQEWGTEEVLSTLEQLRGGRHQSATNKLIFERRSNREFTRKSIGSKRPSATQQVAKLNESDERRETLMTIATKYDQKAFLPTTGDVKEFLAMLGAGTSAIKDRSDGFRQLLVSFMHLPSERLRHLANSSNFSGPAQLGPLSDAIRESGDALRRRGKVLDANNSTRSTDAEQPASDRDADQRSHSPVKP
jgi:hypothetical protein